MAIFMVRSRAECCSPLERRRGFYLYPHGDQPDTTGAPIDLRENMAHRRHPSISVAFKIALRRTSVKLNDRANQSAANASWAIFSRLSRCLSRDHATPKAHSAVGGACEIPSSSLAAEVGFAFEIAACLGQSEMALGAASLIRIENESLLGVRHVDDALRLYIDIRITTRKKTIPRYLLFLVRYHVERFFAVAVNQKANLTLFLKRP